MLQARLVEILGIGIVCGGVVPAFRIFGIHADAEADIVVPHGTDEELFGLAVGGLIEVMAGLGAVKVFRDLVDKILFDERVDVYVLGVMFFGVGVRAVFIV